MNNDDLLYQRSEYFQVFEPTQALGKSEIVWPPRAEEPKRFLENMSNRQLREIIFVQLRMIAVMHSVASRAAQIERDRASVEIQTIIDNVNLWVDEQEEKIDKIVAFRDGAWENNVKELLADNEKLREQLRLAKKARKNTHENEEIWPKIGRKRGK